MNFTDTLIGCAFTRSVRNNAHVHIRQVMDVLIHEMPYIVVGLEFGSGSEISNYSMIDWAVERKIFFTCGRPYKKNDQATIDLKNNYLARRYAFYYGFDTPEKLTV